MRVRVGTCRTRLRYDSDKNTNSLRRWAHLILGTQNQTTSSHPLLHTPTASARPKNNSTQAITIHKLSRGEACTSNLVFRRMATSFFLAPRIPYRIPAFWATKNCSGRSRTRDSSWPPRTPAPSFSDTCRIASSLSVNPLSRLRVDCNRNMLA